MAGVSEDRLTPVNCRYFSTVEKTDPIICITQIYPTLHVFDTTFQTTDSVEVAGIFPVMKKNGVAFDTGDSIILIKRSNPIEFAAEIAAYDSLLDQNFPDLFSVINKTYYDHAKMVLARHNCTKYTLLDLAYSIRKGDHLIEGSMFYSILDSLKLDYTQWPSNWYDTVEQPAYTYWDLILTPILLDCLTKAVQFGDYCQQAGLVGVLTADNQNINGLILDFGDFIKTTPGNGVVVMDSYLSYLMPLITMSRLFDTGTEFDLSCYDLTSFKQGLFDKYFKHWPYEYHPNCVDCTNDLCVLHCSNFNTMFTQFVNPSHFGPIVSKSHYNGVPHICTIGISLASLGVVFNMDAAFDVGTQFTTLFKILSDASLHIINTTPAVDLDTDMYANGFLHRPSTKPVYPGFFNVEFYDFCISRGLFRDGSSLDVKHSYFMQPHTAALQDFALYRFNRFTAVDICQFLFVYSYIWVYFKDYDGGCLDASDVYVRNADRSAGYCMSAYGKAGDYYNSMSHEDQNKLYAFTKRNILPTVTKLNMKVAIAAKERARTVAGVHLFATMTTRCCHQKMLKSITSTPDATIVIGRTKYYGGWDSMLKRMITNINNPVLYGWDYPKCDRAMPNIIRVASCLTLLRSHKDCCSNSDKFYRLVNEHAQVINEYVFVNGSFYTKPGGTSSGDATTAPANSVFNIIQFITTVVVTLLSKNIFNIKDVSSDNLSFLKLQKKLYTSIYNRNPLNHLDDFFINEFYSWCNRYFKLMILSDDGVVCLDSDLLNDGILPSLHDFGAVLYYQNNVFMQPEKCWFESDVRVGPHEFCSQHSLLVEHNGKAIYLPVPDPSRLLASALFINSMDKTVSEDQVERLVALAIDAWPLTKTGNPEHANVFYTFLEFIRLLRSKISDSLFNNYAADLCNSSLDQFCSETFYSNMYDTPPELQSKNVCVVCSNPTVLQCSMCLRTPYLCCYCMHNHVTNTNHCVVSSVTPYVCCISGCSVADVRSLYMSYGKFYCSTHKPNGMCISLYQKDTIFTLYSNVSCHTEFIDVFNKISTCDFSSVDDYDFSDLPDSLVLFGLETIKALEERAKASASIAFYKSSKSPGVISLNWQDVKSIPICNRNSIFAGYRQANNSVTYLGEFAFLPIDGTWYNVITNCVAELNTKCYFVLKTHSVAPLSVSPVFPSGTLLYKHTMEVTNSYVQSKFDVYNSISCKKFFTVQGPPGTGKSHFAIHLAMAFPSARIVYTASSHSAVNSLCEKAAKFLPVHDCSRSKPRGAVQIIYEGFEFNVCTAKYFFCTINSLPRIACDILVIDEVSMCTDYDLSIIRATVNAKTVICVGDPAQLSAPRTLCAKALPASRFNNVVARMCDKGPDHFLDVCYRCPLQIVSYVSFKYYDGQLRTINPQGACFAVHLPGRIVTTSKSVSNPVQASYIGKFISMHPEFSNAVIITPYHGMNIFVQTKYGYNAITVDASQGSEYEYVIFCQTSDTSHSVNPNRLNVSLTRAKKGLCVISTLPIDDFISAGFIDLSVESTVLQAKFLRTLGSNRIVDFNGLDYPHSDIDPKLYSNCVGFDVESVHSTGDAVGTSVPFQVGFYQTDHVDFCVYAEAKISTNDFVTIPFRFPKGPQFAHLKTLLGQRKPWAFVRNIIITYLRRCIRVDGPLVLITWASRMERSVFPYFVKTGVSTVCSVSHCNSCANFYSSKLNNIYCAAHANFCDFLYNPLLFDVEKLCTSRCNLLTFHNSLCSFNHGTAHVSSVDASLTLCAFFTLMLEDCSWTLELPLTTEASKLAKASRIIQKHVVNSVVPTYSTIADIGNPKGIACTAHSYQFYDSNPIAINVVQATYPFSYDADFSLFWNVYLDSYPDDAIVGVWTSPDNKYKLVGRDGGYYYISKHYFYTNAKLDCSNLAPYVFVYVDNSPCSSVTTTFQLQSTRCRTACQRSGIGICKYHYDSFKLALDAYNLLCSAGFSIYVPKSLILQADVDIRFFDVADEPCLCFYIKDSSVYARYKNLPDACIFTNDTDLPTDVAFSLYCKRITTYVPCVSFLYSLGVTACSDSTFFVDNQAVYTAGVNLHPYITNRGTTLFHKSDVTSSVSDDVYISSIPLDKLSVRYDPNTLAGYIDSKPCFNPTTVFLTKYFKGSAVQLPSPDFYDLNRYDGVFIPRSAMEKDFLSMEADNFIAKYNFEHLNLHHVVYGETVKPTIGGLHLRIAMEFNKNKGISYTKYGSQLYSSAKSYSVVFANGSNKSVCTVVDVLLDDFLSVLNSIYKDVSVSKVFSYSIFYRTYRFMLWASNGQVATFYPIMQARPTLTYWHMPKYFFMENAPVMVCDIENYNEPIKLPLGLRTTTCKYYSILQAFSLCTVAFRPGMHITNIGAASHDGYSPLPLVLNNVLCFDYTITDYDPRPFSTVANSSVNSFYTPDTAQRTELVFSDVYSTNKSDHEQIVLALEANLSYGGSVALKFTEQSFSLVYFSFIQKFAYWTIINTHANCTSSEGFLIGINYIGTPQTSYKPESLYNSYIFYRTSYPLRSDALSYTTLWNFHIQPKSVRCFHAKTISKSITIDKILGTGSLIITR